MKYHFFISCIMDDRSFFDNLAPIWDENETLSTPDKVREILEFIKIEKGQAVLDLGTGTGVLIPFIAEKTGPEGKITAVDFSEGMLKRAKAKFSDVVPHPDFFNLDFEVEDIPGKYDRIILYCVYPHLSSPVKSLKKLIENNLKSGGVISIAFPCSEDYINGIHKERKSESDKLPSAGNLSLFLNGQGIKSYVASATDTSYVVNISE